MQYKRWQAKVVEDALKTRRVVLIGGSRQCGKTTLSKTFVNEEVGYLTLDDDSLMNAALDDPANFIKHDKRMLIIDEIQRAPGLLKAVKQTVDEDNRSGQFLLTGSANIQTLPNVQESLAGRIRNVRLRPLSQGEIQGVLPNFLEKSFRQEFSSKDSNYDRRAIMKAALRGGFPEVIQLEFKEGQLWHKDYMTALMERDLRDITNIQKLDAMRQLVEILAAWSGKFMDISKISSHLSIKRPTVESYISALEGMYIVEKVHPWIKTDYDRVGQHPKLYMTDSGLMATLLGWNPDKVWLDGDRIGKLFESFVFTELASLIDAHPGLYKLYHYRDRRQREVDFLVEQENGDLLGIEIKASSSVESKDFKFLQWFQENMAKKKKFTGIVVYSGKKVLSFKGNMWAVPIGNLWS